MIIRQPLQLTETAGSSTSSQRRGRRPAGQAGAVAPRITRALMEFNADCGRLKQAAL